MFYAFFWVIPRRLNFICRRFGTLCLFRLHRQVGLEWLGWEMLGYSYRKITVWPLPSNGLPRHEPYLLHIPARGLHVGRYPPLPALYPDPPLPCHPPSYWLRLFSSQPFSRMNTPIFPNPVILHLPAYEDGSVPKRRHIKFRGREITQNKA